MNGRYFVNKDPNEHARSLQRRSAPSTLRACARSTSEARATPPSEATKDSPLRADTGALPLPRYFAAMAPRNAPAVSEVVKGLNAQGYWPAKLGMNTYPYRADSTATVAPGNFATTMVGDTSDTSPFRDDTLVGISIEAYIRNMSVLIAQLDK